MIDASVTHNIPLSVSLWQLVLNLSCVVLFFPSLLQFVVLSSHRHSMQIYKIFLWRHERYSQSVQTTYRPFELILENIKEAKLGAECVCSYVFWNCFPLCGSDWCVCVWPEDQNLCIGSSLWNWFASASCVPNKHQERREKLVLRWTLDLTYGRWMMNDEWWMMDDRRWKMEDGR